MRIHRLSRHIEIGPEDRAGIAFRNEKLPVIRTAISKVRGGQPAGTGADAPAWFPKMTELPGRPHTGLTDCQITIDIHCQTVRAAKAAL